MKEALTTIEMVEREGQPTEVAITSPHAEGEALDRVLRELGHARSSRLPPVAREAISPGVPISVIPNPAMQLARTQSGMQVLHIRHPGFGWLTFELTPGHLNYLRETEAPNN